MIKTATLKCGVRVIMDRTDYLQSAAVGFWVKTGAVNESDEYAGISHFIEHMMFKGTSSRSAKQIAEDIDRIGGHMNAFTAKEATCYYVKSISEHLFTSMDVIIDMLTDSVFDSEEMDRERNVILEEIKMTEDSPDELAQDMITELVNRGNLLSRSIIGTPETLARIDRDVMVDYYRREYTTDSIVVAITGNFDEERVLEYLEGKLACLGRTKKEPDRTVKPYVPAFRCRVKDIEQSHIYIGTEGCSMSDEDYYALSVLSNILGGNMSSRLFQGVREKKGLAYTVYSALSAASFYGSMYIYAGVAHENVRTATEAIMAELEKIKNGDISQDEVDKAKEQLKVGFIFGMENLLSKMNSLGRSYLLKGEIRTDEEVLSAIESVTLEKVNRLAEKIGDISNWSGVVVSDRDVDMEAIMRQNCR